MPLLWIAVVLGVVEGLTEFLPVSSTGHLILAGHALGFTGAEADAFEVAIQGGAMLAVVWLYRARFSALVRPAPGSAFSGARGISLLAVASIPALALGYLLRGPIERLFDPTMVALGLGVGAAGLLALERFRGDRGTGTVDALTVRVALGIGLFQCLALWPGVSRSAATIAGAMLLGLSRRAAAEFSFLVAVPVLLVASAYKALGAADSLSGDDVVFWVVGAVASAVSAVAAVKAFTALLAKTTLVPFAWYRLVLAMAVVLVLAL